MSLEFSPKPPQQQEAPKTLMQKIKDIIADSPRRLREEYENTTSSWLACLATDIAVVNLTLDTAENEGKVEYGQFIKMKQDLGILENKAAWLQRMFPAIKDESGKVIDKDGGLPESIKEKLAQDLQNLMS